MSWLKEVAAKNMFEKSLTDETCQLDIFPLKALSANIASCNVKCARFRQTFVEKKIKAKGSYTYHGGNPRSLPS